MPFSVKKIVAFGAAFGISVVLAACGLYWLLSRPRGWDGHSVKGISVMVFQSYRGDAGNFSPSGWDLQLVLQNDARSDYIFPVNFKLFTRDATSSALREMKVAIDHPYIIPAKEKTEVRVQIAYSCESTDLETGKTTQSPSRECFNDAFGHSSGFVGFDYATHTRVDLPKPEYAGGPDDAKATPNSAGVTAPDKESNGYDKVYACGVADHLVTNCKTHHFLPLKVPGDPYADLAFSKPLPLLPMPPRGYALDPSPSTCRVANEWHNYCRSIKLSD